MMPNNSEEKSELREVLRKVVAFDKVEIAHDNWADAAKKWNDLMAEMLELNNKTKQQG